MTSKGQLTLPKDIRDALRVGPGDRLQFVLMEDGTCAVLPATWSVQRLRGLIAAPSRAVDIEAMDEAIAEGASSA